MRRVGPLWEYLDDIAKYRSLRFWLPCENDKHKARWERTWKKPLHPRHVTLWDAQKIKQHFHKEEA